MAKKLSKKRKKGVDKGFFMQYYVEAASREARNTKNRQKEFEKSS